MNEFKEYKFICIEKECMKQGQHPCILSFYGDSKCAPDYPNYCPYELDPDDTKYKKWMMIKE